MIKEEKDDLPIGVAIPKGDRMQAKNVFTLLLRGRDQGSCAALYLADDLSLQIVNSSKLRYNHPIPSVLLPESFRRQPALAGRHGALLLRRPI